jgi:hypothetical protein
VAEIGGGRKYFFAGLPALHPLGGIVFPQTPYYLDGSKKSFGGIYLWTAFFLNPSFILTPLHIL